MQAYGGAPGLPVEAISPYAEFETAALVDRFYETEGDPTIGTELSVRLLGHARFAGDPRTTPLVGRDGAQVQVDGRPLVLADYVNYAAQHHFYAVGEILDFLSMKPGTQEYVSTRAAMMGRLNPTGR